MKYLFLPSPLRLHLVCAALLVMGIVGGCSNAASEEVAEPASTTNSETDLLFTEVTESAGLGAFRHETGAFGGKWMPETMGSGSGFIDYNGDGWQDILLVAGAHWPGHGPEIPALQLYHNNGDGTFSRRTEAAGLAGVSAYGMGIAAADYDNDGDQDVFLTAVGQNRLFRNNGDGTFTDVTVQAGLAHRTDWSTAALFFDADRDGWLDLYVGNYVEWTPETDLFCTIDGVTKAYCSNPRLYSGQIGRFYHNNGDGTFTDRTQEAGFGSSPGKTLGVAVFDYNKDGWPDLVVANDTEPNELYINDGDGTFTERGVISGLAFSKNGKARAGMGIDSGVLDGSGEPSVVVGNFSNEMVGLYRHRGRGIFFDRAAAAGIGAASLRSLTFGLFFFDVELDGDLDLLLCNGHIMKAVEDVQDAVAYKQHPQLFLNRGDGTFEEIGPRGVFDERLVGRGAAYADYDRDGDLDVLLTENGGPVRLWRNDLDPLERDHPHFLRIHVEGRESNRDGLGTRIELVVVGALQVRRIRTGSSYLSQSETVATFGLGEHTRVDTLRVYWPSGRVAVFEDVAANQDLLLIEGTGRLQPFRPDRQHAVSEHTKNV